MCAGNTGAVSAITSGELFSNCRRHSPPHRPATVRYAIIFSRYVFGTRTKILWSLPSVAIPPGRQISRGDDCATSSDERRISSRIEPKSVRHRPAINAENNPAAFLVGACLAQFFLFVFGYRKTRIVAAAVDQSHTRVYQSTRLNCYRF